MKIGLFDRRVFKKAAQPIAAVSSILSIVLLFVDMPPDKKIYWGAAFLLLLICIYLLTLRWANTLRNINLKVEGSVVNIKVGDIFEQPGLKAIAFNEYLDTIVDDKIISQASLNGTFIDKHLDVPVAALDAHIGSYAFDGDEILERGVQRNAGKNIKYKLGTICVYNDFLLTAFSKFNDGNIASLKMPEYLEFLLNFWNKVNRVYAQKSVSVTIFGSGITRIHGHRNISDEDLLKIMLWTFRISEMRFKYPAKLTIVIHNDKIDEINLLDIATARNGV